MVSLLYSIPYILLFLLTMLAALPIYDKKHKCSSDFLLRYFLFCCLFLCFF